MSLSVADEIGSGIVEKLIARSSEVVQEGRWATVYRADAGGSFALKVVHADRCDAAREQALAELVCVRAQTRARSGSAKPVACSRFLVDVHFAFEVGGRFIFGMELCARGDLFSLLATHRLSGADAMLLAAEVACGIGELHRLGFMHGDVKTENVGITADGHARLLDFGLAQKIPLGAQVVTGSGSLHHAAPEVLTRRPHGLESDWWSFGVLFSELAFECVPFDGVDIDDTCRSICYEPLDFALAAVREQQAALPAAQQHAPAFMNSAAAFARALLTKEQDTRLGFRGGVDEVLAHEFYGHMTPYEWSWVSFHAGEYVFEFTAAESV